MFYVYCVLCFNNCSATVQAMFIYNRWCRGRVVETNPNKLTNTPAQHSEYSCRWYLKGTGKAQWDGEFGIKQNLTAYYPPIVEI